MYTVYQRCDSRYLAIKVKGRNLVSRVNVG